MTMKSNIDYLNINKKLWNDKTDIHVTSGFYDVPSFLTGKSSLNSIETGLLGNIEGQSLLHLQCHFGLDTLSLASMGARVTGVDLSDRAIEKAKELSRKTKQQANFICSDIYGLRDTLSGTFDIVYTSYGVIGWLPDLKKWAQVIHHYLKPGGLFLLVEFHPIVWIFDGQFQYVKHSYFNYETIIEKTTGTYAEPQAPIENQSVSWNHSISEVLNAIIENGMEIRQFNEYDYSPYNCFKNTIETENGKYRIKSLANKIPMVFAVKARKK